MYQGINKWSGVCCGNRNRRRKACCVYGMCTLICAKTEQQSAFKRLANLEKACAMPWDVLEKKRADHTLMVRSSPGSESPHPGQSIKKRETIY